MTLSLLLVAIAAFRSGNGSAARARTHARRKTISGFHGERETGGHFTQGDSAELHDDSYTIVRVSKVKEDSWRIEARIQYNKKDFPVG